MDYGLPTEFDLIVVGTGVIESMISAAASRIGKRVLQVDTNNYYGGHWASFNLEDIQNINKAEKISIDQKPYESLIDRSEEFVCFSGNKLKKLPYFQIEWHVPQKKPSFTSQNVEENLQEKLAESIDDVKNEMNSVENLSEENINYEDRIIKDKENEQTDSHSKKHNQEEEIALEEVNVNAKVIISQESLKEDYRKFVIDLCPKLQFARGDFVELLISSNIARYAEFRSVSRVLTWINGDLEVVPCSRSDVFANNKVSVVEKRMLMKLLTSIEADEKNLMVPEATTYKDLLKGKKLSNNIIHFVLYALSMSNDETLWLDGIRSTKRFLNSLGRFGKTPFLFSMYGSGEITQAFCRLSAVFGGIFALNQPLHGLILSEDKKFSGLICGKQKITAPHIVMDVTMAPEKFLKNCDTRLISRSVLITDRSLMASEKEHLTLLLYPAKENKLVTVLELGTLTGTCPKNLFLVHLTTKGSSNPKEDLEECINNLFTIDDKDESSRKPKVLWSSYFSIPDTNELELTTDTPSNVFLCPGPDLDLDFDLSVKKAREIFSSIYPNEEFLPRAPDADEIVIEGDPDTETETAIEAEAPSSDLDSSMETGKKSEDAMENSKSATDKEMEKSSETEVGVEARASGSELDSASEIDESLISAQPSLKEVEECVEADENIE